MSSQRTVMLLTTFQLDLAQLIQDHLQELLAKKLA
jgi:hypothetical protein